jgi:hypothetical protein
MGGVDCINLAQDKDWWRALLKCWLPQNSEKFSRVSVQLVASQEGLGPCIMLARNLRTVVSDENYYHPYERPVRNKKSEVVVLYLNVPQNLSEVTACLLSRATFERGSSYCTDTVTSHFAEPLGKFLLVTQHKYGTVRQCLARSLFSYISLALQ